MINSYTLGTEESSVKASSYIHVHVFMHVHVYLEGQTGMCQGCSGERRAGPGCDRRAFRVRWWRGEGVRVGTWCFVVHLAVGWVCVCVCVCVCYTLHQFSSLLHYTKAQSPKNAQPSHHLRPTSNKRFSLQEKTSPATYMHV